MTLSNIRLSVRKKLIAMAVLTTLTALLAASIAMIVYDLRTFHESWKDYLATQARIVAQASAAAVEFNDSKAARENLALLRTQPKILEGAIYAHNGRLFATYVQPGVSRSALPPTPDRSGYRIKGTEITVFYPIVDDREAIGTVYLRARYELLDRLGSYAGIMGLIALGSLALAALVASRLQKTITAPILAVADVARKVMQDRDFSQRAPKTTSDEIGVLVDAFNSMLAEVDQRARALEASNRALQAEMKVRRKTEDELLEADRRKDEFLATLAHELRNPLAPISNGLQILKMKEGDAALSRQTREVMERQLRQMVRLVDDLLDVSRITTGKLTIRSEPIELQDIIRSAVETAQPLIESKRHRLDVALPAVPVKLHGDPTRLAQVISNLLNNAAKYTEPEGAISLKAALEDGRAVIRIADNGIGMSAEMLPRMFEMFTQADQSLARANSGLGVGLSLARRLVELHGGTIEARSAGIGRGSEFIVRLPAVAGEPDAGRSEKPAGNAAIGRRILLADDNVDFADSMASILGALGHEVRCAYDGEQAIAVYREFAPSFAFLDIGLPKMNGYELAAALRALSPDRHCILVAVTGWGQDKDRERAFEAGFDHHLVKPASLDAIQAILGAAE